jgi:ribosomal protein S18 acetylase RimI-like enzyme
LLATRLGERAAYAFGEAIDDPWNPGLKASYLISIAVSPKLRNSGYGGVMLSKWLRAGYDAGARAAELDVDSENHVAKSLYRRFGFQHVRSEEVWRYYFGDADR